MVSTFERICAFARKGVFEGIPYVQRGGEPSFGAVRNAPQKVMASGVRSTGTSLYLCRRACDVTPIPG